MGAEHVKRGGGTRGRKPAPRVAVPRKLAKKLAVEQQQANRLATGAFVLFALGIAAVALIALDVPAKITSSMRLDRRLDAAWAPSTHATASTMLDFPLPLGPTTTVIPGSRSRTVVSAKDLKPLIVRRLRNTAASTPGGARSARPYRRARRPTLASVALVSSPPDPAAIDV